MKHIENIDNFFNYLIDIAGKDDLIGKVLFNQIIEKLIEIKMIAKVNFDDFKHCFKDENMYNMHIDDLKNRGISESNNRVVYENYKLIDGYGNSFINRDNSLKEIDICSYSLSNLLVEYSLMINETNRIQMRNLFYLILNLMRRYALNCKYDDCFISNLVQSYIIIVEKIIVLGSNSSISDFQFAETEFSKNAFYFKKEIIENAIKTLFYLSNSTSCIDIFIKYFSKYRFNFDSFKKIFIDAKKEKGNLYFHLFNLFYLTQNNIQNKLYATEYGFDEIMNFYFKEDIVDANGNIKDLTHKNYLKKVDEYYKQQDVTNLDFNKYFQTKLGFGILEIPNLIANLNYKQLAFCNFIIEPIMQLYETYTIQRCNQLRYVLNERNIGNIYEKDNDDLILWLKEKGKSHGLLNYEFGDLLGVLISDDINNGTKFFVDEFNKEINKRLNDFVTKIKNKYAHIYTKPDKIKQYVLNFFNSAKLFGNENFLNSVDGEFNKIKNNQELMKAIVSSQIFKEEFEQDYKSNIYSAMQGDYTIMIVGFIKAIERYLKEVLIQKYPNSIYTFKNQRRGDLFEFRRGANLTADDLSGRRTNFVCERNAKQLELGGVVYALAYNLSQNSSYQGMFKTIENNGRYQSCAFNNDFVNRLRNGYLHIHMIQTYDEAIELYEKIAYYFRKSIDELNFIIN